MHRYRDTEINRRRDTETEEQKWTRERENPKEREQERDKEREGKTEKETHARTNTHTSKRANDRAHTSILRCPLKLDEVKGHASVFIGLGCREISATVPPPRAPPNRSHLCSHVPHPYFSTSFPLYPVFPLYPFVPFFFSAVLSLTFRQSLHVILCRWCSQIPLPPQS